MPVIHAISSRRRLTPDARTPADELRGLQGWIDALIEARVDVIQIRERDLSAGQLYRLVHASADAASAAGVRLLVNERADVAMMAGASGVHLPTDGFPVSAARRLGGGWYVGRATHGGEPWSREETPDYALFGAVFPSRSHAFAEGAGLAGLAHAVLRLSCPVIAIGGVSVARAPSCIAQGAAGVAGIGLFLPAGVEPEALGPRAAVEALRHAIG